MIRPLGLSVVLLLGCGGAADLEGRSSIASSRGGKGSTIDTSPGGSGGTSASSAPIETPLGGIRPMMPEMKPVYVDNPTGTRLVQLVVEPPILALFEDGSVYEWRYEANAQLDMEQSPTTRHTGFTGAVQLTYLHALAEDGTLGLWSYGPDHSGVVVRQIPGVERAVFLSEQCALGANGDVRCWNEPRKMAGLRVDSDREATLMAVPAAVELHGNLHSQCMLIRDSEGIVTRFFPAMVGGDLQAAGVEIVAMDSPAHRVFDGCIIPKSGAPKCLWAGKVGQFCLSPTDSCPVARLYEVVTDGGEALLLASLGGNLRGCALGESGQVYATLEQPDSESSTIRMKAISGLEHAVFVRAGETVSCAVVPPKILCWGHEGRNAFQPMPVVFSG